MQTSEVIINNGESTEYVIARLDKDRLKDLGRLYAEVFGVGVTDEYILKKYDTAYTGVENTGFIAYSHNKPIAYYGVIPCFIQSGNEIILAAQSADTMTHPKYRYKGMFARLSNMTFDLCRELNIRLIFGFPNQDFYKAAINKSGWRTTETMECFTIYTRNLAMASFFQRVGFLRRIYRKYFFSVLAKKAVTLNGVANSVLHDGFAGVCRSKEYLKYKTYNDSSVIEIGDSKIWVSNKHGLVIGDMEGVNEMNLTSVVSELRKIARRLGVSRVHFHSSPGTSLYKLFVSSYTPTPSFHIIFQDFGSMIPLEKIKFTFADIDIF